MNKKTTIAVAFVAAFAVRAIHAEYNVIDTDFPMSGPTAFTAGAGVTNVYSGLISGTGPAIIGGGGTVVFSHADNTYTGGTTVNDAVFRLDADGCAGSGAITAAVLRASDNDFRSNFSLGGKVTLAQVSKEQESMIQALQAHLQTDFVGIDFLPHGDGWVVNEIEDAAGTRMLYTCSDVDAVQVFIEHIAKTLGV